MTKNKSTNPPYKQRGSVAQGLFIEASQAGAQGAFCATIVSV